MPRRCPAASSSAWRWRAPSSTGPRVLLLDEPFGALDKKLREEMQIELRQLCNGLGLTTILVTHDQEEALMLADRIAVMRSGRIEQVGTRARPSTSARPRTSSPTSWGS